MRVSGPGDAIWLISQQAGLRLQVGQTLTATVERIEAGGAWLRLAGQLLRARTLTPLQVGEQLLLTVESTAQPPHLRLVATLAGPPAPAGSPQLPTGGDAAADLVSRALMAYRLPLETSLVDRLARLVRSWPQGSPPEQVASAAAWLVHTGQAATPEAVARLLQQATGPDGWSLQGRLQQLARALDALAAALPAESPRSPDSPSLADLSRMLRSWTAGQPQEGNPPLQTLLAEVRRQLAKYTTHQSEPGVTAETTLQEVEGFVAAMRQQGRAQGMGTADAGGWLVYPLPLPWPGQEEPQEVLLLYRRAPHRPDPEGPAADELQIRVHAPHLGPLIIQMRQLAGTLSVSVLAEEPEAAAALQQALPQLAAGLSALGPLRVGELAARTGSAPPPSLLRPPQPQVPPGLDRKA